MTSSAPPFILASASPRRARLLRLLDIPFTVQPSRVDEAFDPALPPEQVARRLALRKARDIAGRRPGALVLGADTIVVHRQSVLGKPETPEQAVAMLMQLSGDTHRVLTGVALAQHPADIGKTRETVFSVRTDVTFGELDAAAVERYVAGGSPMDKAGSYGIQDAWGAIFVREIRGDYYNIVGLPLHALYHRLKTFAPALLETAKKD